MSFEITWYKDHIDISIKGVGDNSTEEEKSYVMIDIMNRSGYHCISKTNMDVCNFKFFIENCFEMDVNENAVVDNPLNMNDILRNSRFSSYTGDTCSMPMLVNDKKCEVNKETVMNTIIQFIAEEIKKLRLNHGTFISQVQLSKSNKDKIMEIFRQSGITITDFTTLSSFNEKRRKHIIIKGNRFQRSSQKDATYFNSIRLSSPVTNDEASVFFINQQDKYHLIQGNLKETDKSILTISCRSTHSTYVTLISSNDSITSTKYYFPFSTKENSPIHLNLYLYNEEKKDYSFLGGIETFAFSTTKQLPPVILIVQSSVVYGHQVIMLKIFSTKTFLTKSYLYGDWQQTACEVNQWDFSQASEENEECLFSLIPVIDSVFYLNSNLLLYGRVYDLAGDLMYQGKIEKKVNDSSQQYNTTVEKNVRVNQSQTLQSAFQFAWNPVSMYYSDNKKTLGVCIDKTNSCIYVGSIEDNMPDGKGLILNLDGQPVYQGSFLKGELNGNGKLYSNPNIPEKCYLEGTFENGKISGPFVIYSIESGYKLYSCYFDESVMKGSIFFCNCQVFAGNIVDWKPSLGIQYYLTGYRKYSGPFSNSLAHGKGTSYYYNLNGGNVQLNRNENEESKVGLIEYTGEFKFGVKEGLGTLYSETGCYPLYHGDFQGNVFHGDGNLCITPNIRVDTKEPTTSVPEEVYKNWEVGHDIRNILYYSGSFENGHPTKGIVYFIDKSYASVKWDGEQLVGTKIFIKGEGHAMISGYFTIKDWVITFPSFIKHRDGSGLVRCGMYDNKKHMINSNVFEFEDKSDNEQNNITTRASYHVVSCGNNWNWKYERKLEVNKATRDFDELIKGKEVFKELMMYRIPKGKTITS